MNRFKPFLAASLFWSVSIPAQAVLIQFDYSYDSNGFFSDPVRRGVLEAAGNYFSSLLADDLAAITSNSSNTFTAIFNDPSSGNQVSLPDYNVPADTLIVYAGARDLGATLGQGGPGSYGVRYTDPKYYELVRTRGEADETEGATATDFAPWGGAIAFDIDANWYFDADPATDEAITGIDFYSVALHELGHLLGVGTADSWSNQISGGYFNGSASLAAYGSSVPLDSIDAHWAPGTMSILPDGTPQEAAMDPDLTTGTRKRFTVLDQAALSDIGWEVTPVPVPAALWLFAGGLLGLLGMSRRG